MSRLAYKQVSTLDGNYDRVTINRGAVQDIRLTIG
jgi:hypothetical protein